MFSQNFMKDFGSLLSHVRRIENKETIVENVSGKFFGISFGIYGCGMLETVC